MRRASSVAAMEKGKSASHDDENLRFQEEARALLAEPREAKKQALPFWKDF